MVLVPCALVARPCGAAASVDACRRPPLRRPSSLALALACALLLGVAAGCTTAADDPKVDAAPIAEAPRTNSNACLLRMGALQPVCPSADAPALPTEACCAAYKLFQEDACGCSPLVKTLMGVSAKGESQLDRMVAGLDLLCPGKGVEVVKPDCTAPVSISGIPTGAAKTYHDGTCELADWELDNKRFQSLVAFNAWFETFGKATSGCVDYEALLAEFAKAFDPDADDKKSPYIDVPYGIGQYRSLKNMVEYLAIILPDINKDAWRFHAETTQSDDSMLYFAPDGATIISATHAAVRSYKDCFDGAEGYYETIARYVGCRATINSIKIPVRSEVPGQTDRITAVPALVSDFYQAGTTSTTWGAVNICMTHELHCTGKNKQFDSFDDCMQFVGALPPISAACQDAGKLFAGDSLLCRMKHHFMIPFEPETHCFHIGRGLKDADDHIKCIDSECDDPLIRGGPMDLLTLAPAPAAAACIVAADAISTPTNGPKQSPWPTGFVCKPK